MSGFPRNEFMEEFAIVAGLITMQVIYAVYGVFMSRLLSIGLSPLFLIIYGSLATSFILSPWAVYFEKSKWPSEFNPKLLIQFVLIAFGGVTAFPALMLMGIKETSPAIASAMPNLAPGLIFVIAWCLRLEKVDLKCKYSRAKITGTLVCLAGALSISFLQGPSISSAPAAHHGSQFLNSLSNEATEKNRIMGCMYLLAAVVAVSCTMVLQASTLAEFPAPLTLCSVTSLIGTFLTGVLQFIQEGKIEIGTPLLTVGTLVGLSALGGSWSGLCIAFQAWSVRKRGPVLVSAFSPIGTVCTAILSALTLGEAITVGSIIGMLLMFGGLYFVLWAKKKEGYNFMEDESEIHDTKKLLLS
ncbi:WAT1-related protein At5g47470-like isoform X1 [Magnolia sinica]|uniref:WAT1-related protein At5g47470-like isoform X1 n=1 Tax=Magnolia sinica TaxID=86752 RepID=UPI00265AED3A|nr:WAT1-related protein At5g47470-like isoform X1 [Magnolia sinica]